MDWQVAIDIKIFENKDWRLLDDLLLFAKGKNWLYVMFTDRLYSRMNEDIMWLINKDLQQVRTSSYNYVSEESSIVLDPDLTNGLNEDEKAEVEGVTCYFLQTIEPPHKIYVLTADRNATKATQLGICSVSSKNVYLLTIDTSDNIRQFFHAHEPKLVQAKHIPQQVRNIGGKIASTFKAWNPHNQDYAEKLLKEAFYASGAQLLPPEELYIWDSENETYVRFMHSGKWEYHGHDFDEYDRVPNDVKKRYNHWKK